LESSTLRTPKALESANFFDISAGNTEVRIYKTNFCSPYVTSAPGSATEKTTKKTPLSGEGLLLPSLRIDANMQAHAYHLLLFPVMITRLGLC
jgi:hypothetical protein